MKNLMIMITCVLIACSCSSVIKTKRIGYIDALRNDDRPLIKQYLLEKEKLYACDAKGVPLLSIVALEGKTELVGWMVSNGVDLNIKGETNLTPIDFAAFAGHLDTLKLLYNMGARPGVKGAFPVHSALRGMSSNSWKSQFEIVKFLVEQGSDLSLRVPLNDETPLHIAATAGVVPVIKYLVENGADVNAYARTGTPLHCAVRAGDYDSVEYLVLTGSELSTPDLDGNTSLHLAVLNEKRDICEYLLKAGAKLNIKNAMKDTALHIAVQKDAPEYVRLILSAGAQKNIYDRNRKTPLDIAKEKGNIKIQALFKK